MESTQQAAEATSSQLTQTTVAETHPLQSAQEPRTEAIGDSAMTRTPKVPHNTANISADNHDHPMKDASSFTTSLNQYQRELDENFNTFEETINKADPSEDSIDDFDWDDLEDEYQKEIGKIVMTERDIMNEFDARFKVCHNQRVRVLLT